MDAPIKYQLVEVWEKLPNWKRHELMARARAEDTMQAWENYLALPKDQR